jgi:hypothetical protein
MNIPSKAQTDFIICRAGLENQALDLRRKGCELRKGRHDCRQSIVQSVFCVSIVVRVIFFLLKISCSPSLSNLPGLTTPLYALAARQSDTTISKDRNEEGVLDTLSRD